MTTSQHEPTNEQLWLQPPADTAAQPGQAVAPYTPPVPAAPAVQAPLQGRPDRTSFVLAIVSMGCAIPLSGIGAGVLGFPGLLVVWLGIVLVNVVYGTTHRPH